MLAQKQKRPGLFARLAHSVFGDRRGFSRRHERYACFILGRMEIEEIQASFEGAILELSLGGCSFRPASLFLLDRENEMVVVRTGGFSVRGQIRATRPESYGIKFTRDLTREEMDVALSESLQPS